MRIASELTTVQISIVPQDLHRHPRVNVKIRQQRGAGAASVADGDPADAGGVAAAIPVAVEVPRLDRQTEHEDLDVRGVERVPVGACRFEELASFVGDVTTADELSLDAWIAGVGSRVAAVEEWISKLDQLLAKPFGIDGQGRPEPHHVDLRESQSFYDWETEEGDFARALESFEADRTRLAKALTSRYGVPERMNIRPYFDGDASPDDPGGALFEYLTGWFFEIELWRAGSRGVVAQVGHYDKELPLQLMLVVGDVSAGDPTRPWCRAVATRYDCR